MKCAGLIAKMTKILGDPKEAESYVNSLTARVKARMSGAHESPGLTALTEREVYKQLIAGDAAIRTRDAAARRVRDLVTLEKGLADYDNILAVQGQKVSIGDAFLAGMVGIMKNVRGAQGSASMIHSALKTKFIGPFQDRLNNEHGWVRELIKKGSNPDIPLTGIRAAKEELVKVNRSLEKELLDLGKDGKFKSAAPVSGDPAVRSLALDLATVGWRIRERFTANGVMTEAMSGHIPQAWDSVKLLAAGKEAAVKELMQAVDWNHKAYAGLNYAEKELLVTSQFDNITSGQMGSPSGAQSLGVGKNITGHRQIFLKDGQWEPMMSKYGTTTNLVEAYMNKFTTDIRELALVEKYGPNYQKSMMTNLETVRHGIQTNLIKLDIRSELPRMTLGDDKTMKPFTRRAYDKFLAEGERLVKRQAAGEDVTQELAAQAVRYGDFERAAKTRAENRLAGLYEFVKDGKGGTGGTEERAWAVITGQIDRVANPSRASIGVNIRAAVSMIMLGRAVFSALADVGVVHHNYLNVGMGNVEAWGHTLGGLGRGFQMHFKHGLGDGPGAREVAAMLAGYNENLIGGMYSRFIGEDAGKMAGTMDLYYRLNMLTPWTEANRSAVAITTAQWLGTHSDKEFSALNQGLRDSLGMVGIGEAEWGAIRKGAIEYEGKKVILPGEINKRITDADLAGMVDAEVANIGKPRTDGLLPAMIPAGATEAEIREAATRAVRDRLESLSTQYIHHEIRQSVLGVTDPVKAIMGHVQGGQKGTVSGEIMRMFTQFKSFPIAQAYHTIGALAGSRKTTGQKVASGAHLMLNMTLLGAAAMTLKDLSKGDTPRDFTQMGTWTSAMAQGGALGIYGDFLLGNFSRYGNSLGETLAGPLVSGPMSLLVNNLSLRNLLGGESSTQSKIHAGVKDLVRNAPVANLWYVKPVLDTLLWNPIYEGIKPGSVGLAERNKKKVTGQTSWTGSLSRELGLVR